MSVAELDRKTETIPTNLRLLLVLEVVSRAGVPVTPTDVNAEIGLPKPTIHRLFATLEAEGFLQRELDGRTYTVGRRCRKMSMNIMSSMRMRTARVAILTRLADQIGETCNIAVPERQAMIYLDRIETKWPLRIQLPIGTQVPFYCTASGKMYLSTFQDSHLKRYLLASRFDARTDRTITDPARIKDEAQITRERGHAEDDEEFMDGMIAIAVPIKDDLGRLISTLSFHAPTQRLSIESSREHLPHLRQAASELSDLVAS
ncbi:MAG: IclR family transcriptional regulator [Hyphomicrobiales bacterium]